MNMKKKQSHSFLTENKRSTTEHITAKSDPKSHVSKNPPSTQVSVRKWLHKLRKEKEEDSNIWEKTICVKSRDCEQT